MPSKSTKTVAARVPLDIYYKMVEDAARKGITLSDYTCGLIYNYYENGQEHNSQDIEGYKLRTRKAFTAAVNFAVREYRADGDEIVKVFNTAMG